MKKLGSADGWLKLWINENWSTFFYLVPSGKEVGENDSKKYPELNERTLYDIKLPNGREFLGCKINISTHTREGRGGMDEGSSFSEAFFEAEDLTIKLKSGMLLRANVAATTLQKKKDRRREDAGVLENLIQQRNELNKKIDLLRKK